MKRYSFFFLMVSTLLFPTITHAAGSGFAYARYHHDQAGATWESEDIAISGTRVEVWTKMGAFSKDNPKQLSIMNILNFLGKQGWELISFQDNGREGVYYFKKKK